MTDGTLKMASKGFEQVLTMRCPVRGKSEPLCFCFMSKGDVLTSAKFFNWLSLKDVIFDMSKSIIIVFEFGSHKVPNKV